MLTLLVVALWPVLPGRASADLSAGLGAYLDGDYGTALSELRPLAEAGDVVAQYYLGEMHLRGQGVAQDFAKAVVWYAKAAEYGHPEAQAALGALELLGLGTPRHPRSAYFWLIVSVVWTESELRAAAFEALGDVAVQLSPAEKSAIAQAAVPQWRRQ
jgi:hypothetical protein